MNVIPSIPTFVTLPLPLAVTFSPQTWEFLRRAAAIALIIILALVAYHVANRGLTLLHRRGRLSFALTFLFRRILRWIAFIVMLLLVLQSMGVLHNAWTAITALFGLIAIGFVAVWSVLSNAMCAILLIMTRPFEIGDTIEMPAEAGGIKGKAINFNLLYTTLEDGSGTLIQVPNNLFFQKPIKRVIGQVQVSLDEQLMKETETR